MAERGRRRAHDRLAREMGCPPGAEHRRTPADAQSIHRARGGNAEAAGRARALSTVDRGPRYRGASRGIQPRVREPLRRLRDSRRTAGVATGRAGSRALPGRHFDDRARRARRSDRRDARADARHIRAIYFLAARRYGARHRLLGRAPVYGGGHPLADRAERLARATGRRRTWSSSWQRSRGATEKVRSG